jgi:hypothetical protein
LTVKVTLGATIPIAQYANLQPSFEVEGATVDDAMATALATMKRVWDSVSDKPLSIKEAQQVVAAGVELTCWASGTVVSFDPVAHVYSPGRWLSGSAFASRFTSDFPADMIAGRMADKAGVDAADVLAMWAKNAEASSTFGTAVHAALELYGKYLSLSRIVKGTDESAMTKNPVLKPIVEAFFEGRAGEDAHYEVFVADPVLKHCGQIDRLLVVEGRTIRVQDFKTNTDLTKSESISLPFKGVVESSKLGAYWLQLSFYARILQSHGFVVEGLDIFHWDGSSWVTYSHDVVDISEVL